MITIIDGVLWATGLLVWTALITVVLYIVGSLCTFAYRLGWKISWDLWQQGIWWRWIFSPPDMFEEVYFPSAGGRRLRAKHEQLTSNPRPAPSTTSDEPLDRIEKGLDRIAGKASTPTQAYTRPLFGEEK